MRARQLFDSFDSGMHTWRASPTSSGTRRFEMPAFSMWSCPTSSIEAFSGFFTSSCITTLMKTLRGCSPLPLGGMVRVLKTRPGRGCIISTGGRPRPPGPPGMPARTRSRSITPCSRIACLHELELARDSEQCIHARTKAQARQSEMRANREGESARTSTCTHTHMSTHRNTVAIITHPASEGDLAPLACPRPSSSRLRRSRLKPRNLAPNHN